MSRANYPAHRAFPTSILYRNKLVIYTPSLIFPVFFHRIRPLPSVLRKHLSAPHPGVHCCPGQSLIFTCGNRISLFRCFPFCKKLPKPFSKNSETAEDSKLMHIQILFPYNQDTQNAFFNSQLQPFPKDGAFFRRIFCSLGLHTTSAPLFHSLLRKEGFKCWINLHCC